MSTTTYKIPKTEVLNPFMGATVPTAEQLTEMLPDYTVDQFYGVGKAGAVYRAVQTKLDRVVAVKVLPSQFYHDEKLRALFDDDARRLGSLSHENITKVFDHGVVNEMLYLVTEFVEGVTFADFLMQRLLTRQETAYYAIMLCDALIHAHDKGIIHKAIRGRNLMITTDNELKLVDFSVAGSGDLVDGNVDTSGIDYVAPELINTPDNTDHRVDIYAVGVFILKCLTGFGPKQYIEAGTPGIYSLGCMHELVYHCVRTNPADRYQTVEAVKLQLQQVLNEV